MQEILVGIKPGRLPEALDALELAALLASAYRSHVVAVSVVESPQRKDEAERQMGEAIAELTARVASTPQIDALAFVDPSPAHALHQVTVELTPAAVALGSSRRAAEGRVSPGMVGERLLQGGRAPVAIAPPGFARRDGPRIRTVGAAFVDTREGRDALARAIDLADRAGARLRVISVVERSPVESSPDARRRARERTRALVEALARGADAEVVVLDGDPLDLLTDATADLDLLVVGSRGYGPLRAIVLGGVSSQLAHEAACPLLVLPRLALPDHAADRAEGARVARDANANPP